MSSTAPAKHPVFSPEQPQFSHASPLCPTYVLGLVTRGVLGADQDGEQRDPSELGFEERITVRQINTAER